MARVQRIVKRVLHTPVVEYVNPGTGRVVAVVAVSHMGEARYYDEIRAILNRREMAGAVVMSEGSRKVLNPHDATPQETACLELIEHYGKLFASRVPLLGWVLQQEALSWADSWQIHDLSRLDVLRLTGVEPMIARMSKAMKLVEWDEADPLGPVGFRMRVAGVQRLYGLRTSWLGRRLITAPAWDRIVVGHRSRIMLTALDATDRDAAVLYGAGHLPDFDSGLRMRGMRRVRTTWLRVGRLPSIREEAKAVSAIRKQISRQQKKAAATAESVAGGVK